MSPLAQVLLVGVGTYLIRASAIAFAGRLKEPSSTTQATLRLIGPAVLAAIVADQLLLDGGDVTVRWSWLIAAAVAGWVSYRWRRAGVTMIVGMLLVWTLDAIGLG